MRRLAALTLFVGACGPTSSERLPPRDLSVMLADMASPSPDLAMEIVDMAVPRGPLTISPSSPMVMVTVGQTPPTLQFTATIDNQPVQVAWGVDRGEIGSIDSTGLFTTPGTLGGVATVTAIYGAEKATTPVAVQLTRIDVGDPAFANPADGGAGGYGGVGGDGPGPAATMNQRTVLDGASTVDGTVRVLYPYDSTVWPRGLLPPLFQWNPGAHKFDAVRVHIREANFEYKGYFAANDAAAFDNLPLPVDAWTQLTYSNAGEPVSVALTFAEGTQVFGPYRQTWKIAPATLKGTVYYNSYGTYLVQNSDTGDITGKQYGAGTLAIKPGNTAPALIAGVNSPGNASGCRVCHTVSTNGKVLVTQKSDSTAASYAGSVYIDLLNDSTAGAGTLMAGTFLSFPALSPDGSLLLSSSGGMAFSDSESRLYSLPAGTFVTGVTGLPASFQATLPVFSPDGKRVAFNFWNGSFAGGPSADRASLAMLDFDGVKTFSNPRILHTPASQSTPVTWSSFLPDGTGVVFNLEVLNASNSFGYTWQGNKGELWWVHIATKIAHRLDTLNGLNLPESTLHPAGLDAQLNYEPTVNPIASGGYAWVVFTSRRMYGNVAAISPWDSDPRGYDSSVKVTTKKLWVAAIDLNPAPGTDPSHAAFYLPAQELRAGNARGFWTVDPCRMDGAACATGDECCGGYCRPGDGGTALVCSSQTPVCAAEFEKCKVDGDCCGVAQYITCINEVCTLSRPPVP